MAGHVVTLVMAAKENLPTLTMLGLNLIFSDPDLKVFLQAQEARPRCHQQPPPFMGWYLDPGERRLVRYRGCLSSSRCWRRQYYGTDGPIYLSNRFTEFGGSGGSPLAALFSALREPGRLDYLLYLLRSVGWLPLLAPEYLLLGLSVLWPTCCPTSPASSSGEQHLTRCWCPCW